MASRTPPASPSLSTTSSRSPITSTRAILLTFVPLVLPTASFPPGDQGLACFNHVSAEFHSVPVILAEILTGRMVKFVPLADEHRIMEAMKIIMPPGLATVPNAWAVFKECMEGVGKPDQKPGHQIGGRGNDRDWEGEREWQRDMKEGMKKGWVKEKYIPEAMVSAVECALHLWVTGSYVESTRLELNWSAIRWGAVWQILDKVTRDGCMRMLWQQYLEYCAEPTFSAGHRAINEVWTHHEKLVAFEKVIEGAQEKASVAPVAVMHL